MPDIKHACASVLLQTLHSIVNVSCGTLNSPLCPSQGEGQDASGPSRLPGRAGHPAAVGRWRTSATDHQPGYKLCLWPVSPMMHDQLRVNWPIFLSVRIYLTI